MKPPPSLRFARLSGLLLLVGGLASAVAAQECPAGGVLDDERAYFGSTLGPNVCSPQGARCESVLFFSEQRSAEAVCDGGRWRPASADAGPGEPCPRFVFSDDEVWQGGEYRANVCSAASAPTCGTAFFGRLPDGSSGYRPVVCRDGRWRPEGEGGGDPTSGRSSRLRTASAEEVIETLREGLRRTYSGESPFLGGPGGPLAGGPSGQPDGGGGGGGGIPVSETNVQEAGVDEADRVKSDGRHLYVLKELSPDVRILEIDPTALAAHALEDFRVPVPHAVATGGLYLRSDQDQLVLVASNSDVGWGFWYDPFSWRGSQSTIASVDVTAPGAPFLDGRVTLDGTVVSSRRIGDTLLVVTRFQPQIDGLTPFVPGGRDAFDALRRIEAAQATQLLPLYRTAVNPLSRPLVDPAECYLPPEDSPIRTADVITLLAIDLESMEPVSAKCFVGASETLYVSQTSVYVASTRYDYTFEGLGGVPSIDFGAGAVETDLHKFSLGGGAIEYVASGAVDGHLGFNVYRRPFRLSERDDLLRIVTYTDELTPDRSPVLLTVLGERDGELVEVSRLPNARRPEPLGKPGEELYATRFVGDRAYLVTFLVTDPLYVVDLADPRVPYVAGELEIAGYSDYLHPVGEDLVVGVGKDAIPDPDGDFRGAWYQGVKISLFDVSDPSRPRETDSVIVGRRGSDAAVLRDHHAFTFLEPEQGLPRFALGARVHEQPLGINPGRPWEYFGWSYSGLFLFEVDTATSRLVRRGELRVEVPEPRPDGQSTLPIEGYDRSVLAGDAVFYVHGSAVFTAHWADPWGFEGPR